MYIYKEMESTDYWHQANQRSIKFERSCINGNVMTRNDSPTDGIHSQPDTYCKTENIYQYCDRNFNFSALSAVSGGGIISEDDEYNTYPSHKRKLTSVARDPMSHRIIEKRRRDRMNKCLNDLSRLIPSEYLKKGRGRIEKTEIIEMAIKHMKYLQSRVCDNIEKNDLQYKNVHDQSDSSENIQHCLNESPPPPHQINDVSFKEAYKGGFQECLSEVIHYLIEVEGYEYPGDKMFRLMNHLEQHYDRIIKGEKQICHNRIDIVSSSSSSSSAASSIRNGAGDSTFSMDVTNLHRQQQYDQPQQDNDVSTASRAAVRMDIIISPSTDSYKYNDNRNDTYNDHHDSSVTDYTSHEKTNDHNNEDNNDNYTINHEMTTDGHQRHQSRNNDNNGDDPNNNSQLREILTGLPSSHISTTTVFAPQARPNIIRKLPLQSSPSTHHNAIIGSNDQQQVSAANSLYKFKNNIKERFSAEHSTNSVIITSDTYPSKRRRVSTTDDNSSVHSDQTLNDDTTPPPPSLAHTSVKFIRASPTTITSHPVPIFALHSKGAFYVPLTVNSDLLNPFLNDLDADLNVNTFPSLVLHPVTISVNFQTQGMQPVKSFNSVLSSAWNASSQSKVMSVPKWSPCANM